MKKTTGKWDLGQVLTDLLFCTAGSALVALSISMFTVPNDIAPGGVSGLATALAHITPVRVSLWSLALNLPLLLGAWRILGLRPLLLTLLCTLQLSAFIELVDLLLPAYGNNPLLGAVFGGVTCGLGIGLLLLRGVSSGGTDLLALLLKRSILPNASTGAILLGADATVVTVAVLVFRDIDVALYSAITIFIASKVIDAMAQGVDYAKVVYVVTDRGEEVTKALTTFLDRGTTVIPAYGGYTKDEKQLVITVTRRSYLAQTLRLIKQTDGAAFTFVMDSTEVHGEGFKLD